MWVESFSHDGVQRICLTCAALSREREEREAESDFRMRECFMSPFCLHETLANLRNVDARREVICGSLLECCERGYT